MFWDHFLQINAIPTYQKVAQSQNKCWKTTATTVQNIFCQCECFGIFTIIMIWEKISFQFGQTINVYFHRHKTSKWGSSVNVGFEQWHLFGKEKIGPWKCYHIKIVLLHCFCTVYNNNSVVIPLIIKGMTTEHHLKWYGIIIKLSLLWLRLYPALLAILLSTGLGKGATI